MNRLALPALAVLLCAGFPEVTVTSPWARATAPGQTEAAVYLQLTSARPDRLTSIDAPDGMAMLHKSVTKNGMSDMMDMETLALPMGQTVSLSPGGMHIMLMHLTHGLTAGTTVRLTLHFARALPVEVVAPVLPIGARGP
jgi:copper(I)-binding protein